MEDKHIHAAEERERLARILERTALRVVRGTVTIPGDYSATQTYYISLVDWLRDERENGVWVDND